MFDYNYIFMYENRKEIFLENKTSNNIIDMDITSLKSLPILPNINTSEKKYQSSIPTITEGSKLGCGGYGTVLKCIDKNGIEMAVKKICTDDNGISCLLELSIMSTVDHPNINKAFEIHCEPNMVYIIQELAVSDLKAYRSLHDPSLDQIIKWLYQVLQGLYHLHQKGIIHGDIKSSNILIYKDLSIKLSDFTLSSKDNWINNYMACTSSHRPIEVWLNISGWNKSVDIWSLGCTLFELVYGYSLFPSQKIDSSINAIIDWSNNELVKKNTQQNMYLKLRDVAHHSYILPPSFALDNSIKGQLNSLIISMLKIDPKERPSVTKLLTSPLFSSLSSSSLSSSSSSISSSSIHQIDITIPKILIPKPKILDLSKRTQTRVRNIMMKLVENEIILEHSLFLYSKLKNLYNISDDLKSHTCVWISYKLIYKNALPQSKLTIPYHKISETERIICYHLRFKLHSDI